PDRSEIGELTLLVLERRRDPVEVLHPHDEAPPGRACCEPGDERCAEVAEVQRAGRRRCEAAGHVTILDGASGRATETAAGEPPARQLSRRERMALLLERDGAECVWCRRPLEVGLVAATTEHLVPRIKGGPSWIENELAACRRCNGERGHRTPAEW